MSTAQRLVDLRNLLKSHVEAQNWGQALAVVDEMVELKPDDPAILYNKAMVHCRRQELDLAMAYILRTLELDPDSSQAKTALDRIGEMLRSPEPVAPDRRQAC